MAAKAASPTFLMYSGRFMDRNLNTNRVNTQGVHHTISSWMKYGDREDTSRVQRKAPKKTPASKKTDAGLRAGQRLRDARVALCISLAELSNRIGKKLSGSRIGNYEQGIRELGIQEAEWLAPALHQPAAYLIGLVDELERDLLRLPRSTKHALLATAVSLGASSSPPRPEPPNAAIGEEKQKSSGERRRGGRTSSTGLQ